MGAKRATVCRFCKEPGELYKGAHPACKADEYRAHTRLKRGIPPERWRHEVDRNPTCATCEKRPRAGKSLDCEECRTARVTALKRKAHGLYMKRRRAANMPLRKCACGCGVEFRDFRRIYATPECHPKRKRKPAAPRPVVRKSFKAAPEKPVEPEWRIVVPEGMTVTKCPPVGPQSRWDL